MCSSGPKVACSGGGGGWVYFRACVESDNEVVDLLFESAAGEIGAEVEFVEVSDEGAREGCDCVAVGKRVAAICGLI
jgi:hypothetical protein